DEEKDQAGGDLQHQRRDREALEHARAEARRDGDGADREQECARRETQAKGAVALLGGGGERAEQLDRTEHQEEQCEDHAPGDGPLGDEHTVRLRGGDGGQQAERDGGGETLHGNVMPDGASSVTVSTAYDRNKPTAV